MIDEINTGNPLEKLANALIRRCPCMTIEVRLQGDKGISRETFALEGYEGKDKDSYRPEDIPVTAIISDGVLSEKCFFGAYGGILRELSQEDITEILGIEPLLEKCPILYPDGYDSEDKKVCREVRRNFFEKVRDDFYERNQKV